MENSILLVLTSYMCPEQYDAFYNKKPVGYLRLRHGRFTVNYKDPCGREILVCHPEGDGAFEYKERDAYLDMAVKKISEEMLNEDLIDQQDFDDISYHVKYEMDLPENSPSI